MTRVWEAGGVRITVSASHGIADINYAGPMTADTLAASLVFLDQELRHSRVLAMVIRVRSALWCCGATAVTKALSAYFEREWLRAPAAIIASPEDVAELECSSAAMRRHGILRAVFTEAWLARAWALQRAHGQAWHQAETTGFSPSLPPSEPSQWRLRP